MLKQASQQATTNASSIRSCLDFSMQGHRQSCFSDMVAVVVEEKELNGRSYAPQKGYTTEAIFSLNLE